MSKKANINITIEIESNLRQCLFIFRDQHLLDGNIGVDNFLKLRLSWPNFPSFAIFACLLVTKNDSKCNNLLLGYFISFIQSVTDWRFIFQPVRI